MSLVGFFFLLYAWGWWSRTKFHVHFFWFFTFEKFTFLQRQGKTLLPRRPFVCSKLSLFIPLLLLRPPRQRQAGWRRHHFLWFITFIQLSRLKCSSLALQWRIQDFAKGGANFLKGHNTLHRNLLGGDQGNFFRPRGARRGVMHPLPTLGFATVALVWRFDTAFVCCSWKRFSVVHLWV